MNWKDPIYINFKKNEVVRPATVGMYWIVIALCMVFLIATLMTSPASAAEFDPVYVYNLSPNTTFVNYMGGIGNNGELWSTDPFLEPFGLQHGCTRFPAGSSDDPENPGIYNMSNSGCSVSGFGTAAMYYGCTIDVCSPGDYWSYIGWQHNSAWNYSIASWLWHDNLVPAPVCSFVASPTTGISPLFVSFNDTTTNTPTMWQWIVAINNTGTTVATSTSKNWAGYIVGINQYFDVYLNAANAGGSCTLISPKYLSTMGSGTNLTGPIVVNLDVKNAVTGNLIYDSQVGIQNFTSKEWRNSTSPTGLVYFDSTGPAFEYPLSIGETIQESACATGYQCANITFAIPYHNYKSYLNLVPDTVINSTGTFTLVTTVVMQKSGLPIREASVSLDTGALKLTNSAGAATFYNLTAGSHKATASFIGYQAAEKTFTGIAGETKMITLQLVVNGETPVPTQMSPTVTPVPAGNLTEANAKGANLIDQILNILIDIGVFVILLLFIWFCAKIAKDIFGI